jgi:tetratricopeptide (TPR) repeat protein
MRMPIRDSARLLGPAILALSLLFGIIGCASNIRRELAVEYYNLGNAYYKIKRYEEAIGYFGKSISQDPSLLKAHFNLSLALIKQGRGNEAHEILSELLTRDPDNLDILQLLGYSLYVQGKGDEALIVFDQILEMEPQNLNARYNRGIVLWDIGRVEEAEQTFSDLLAILSEKDDELYPDTLFNLGKLLFDTDRSEEAITYLERYVEWRAKDIEAFLLLAGAHRKIERYDRALESYSQVLKLDNERKEVWMDRAEILLTKVQDPILGLEALSRALSLGFADEARIEALLNDSGLVDRVRVEAVLKSWNLLP